MAETAHIGKNITRIRELQGMKQETLTEVLGVSQQAISKIELSESIEDVTLERVAKALGVNPNFVKNLTKKMPCLTFKIITKVQIIPVQ